MLYTETCMLVKLVSLVWKIHVSDIFSKQTFCIRYQWINLLSPSWVQHAPISSVSDSQFQVVFKRGLQPCVMCVHSHEANTWRDWWYLEAMRYKISCSIWYLGSNYISLLSIFSAGQSFAALVGFFFRGPSLFQGVATFAWDSPPL